MKAYSNLKKRIDKLRLKSMSAINAITKQRSLLERDIGILEAKRHLIHLVSVGLNILGLSIVMLKDLPVWRDSSRSRGEQT